MDIISSSADYSISEISNLHEEDSSTIPSIASSSSILSLSILKSPNKKKKPALSQNDIIVDKADAQGNSDVLSKNDKKIDFMNFKSKSSSSSLNHYVIPSEGSSSSFQIPSTTETDSHPFNIYSKLNRNNNTNNVGILYNIIKLSP